MISIRKFVGYTGAAAGIAAAIALAMASQAVVAAAPTSRVGDQPATMQSAPSAECTAAIQTIKTAAINDSKEDASERSIAKTNPDEATDVSEDGDELANFKSLFSIARARRTWRRRSCSLTAAIRSRSAKPMLKCPPGRGIRKLSQMRCGSGVVNGTVDGATEGPENTMFWATSSALRMSRRTTNGLNLGGMARPSTMPARTPNPSTTTSVKG